MHTATRSIQLKSTTSRATAVPNTNCQMRPPRASELSAAQGTRKRSCPRAHWQLGRNRLSRHAWNVTLWRLDRHHLRFRTVPNNASAGATDSKSKGLNATPSIYIYGFYVNLLHNAHACYVSSRLRAAHGYPQRKTHVPVLVFSTASCSAKITYRPWRLALLPRNSKSMWRSVVAPPIPGAARALLKHSKLHNPRVKSV